MTPLRYRTVAILIANTFAWRGTNRTVNGQAVDRFGSQIAREASPK